jgi:hypothetical protein
MPEALEQARAILGQTLGMEACARDGRWDELPALESARAALIASWRPAAVGPAAGDLADCVAQIVSASERVARLCEERRDQLLELLRGSRRGRQAARTYENDAGAF